MNGRQKNRVSTLVVRLLYIIGITLYFCMMAWLLSGCERRELYVYGDNFQSVELEVNWRKYADRDPDGMTVWFYPLGGDPLERPYRTTTANVRHQNIYLPGGLYRGVVIDFSPDEFSRQQFLDLDSLNGVRVEATPMFYQPDSLTITGDGVPEGLNDEVNEAVFGEAAWSDKQAERPELSDNGLYKVVNQPEMMALDTLTYVVIERGEYGDYVPWKEKDSYQSTIRLKKILSEPVAIVWTLRIHIWVRSGFNSLWQMPATVTGMADGHYLAGDKNTERSCMLRIEGWETERTGEDSGYISATLNTFGLRPSSINDGHDPQAVTRSAKVRQAESRAGEDEPVYDDPSWYVSETDLCDPSQLRLNIAFVLRDHSTAVYYHYDVGDQLVSFDAQEVMRIDLGPDFYEAHPDVKAIDLPYVEAYDGAGFDADVTPWEHGGDADTTL